MRPFSITFALASTNAVPEHIKDLDPPVPVPLTSWSESLCIKRILSNGTPSSVATICPNVVPWPCP